MGETNQSKCRLVSPDDMFAAAKRMMLNGREPQNENDWKLVVNFFAANVHEGLEDSGVSLLCKIFEVPLSRKQIQDIIDFQKRDKKKEKLKKVGGPRFNSYN